MNMKVTFEFMKQLTFEKNLRSEKPKMICCGMLPGTQLQYIQGESLCTGLLAHLLLHSKEKEETLQTLQTLLLLCAPVVADHTHLTLLLPTLDSQLETQI